jgi:hypothetical protein
MDLTLTVGTSIPLQDARGRAVPNMDVYKKIEELVEKKAEEYDQDVLEGLFVRVYLPREYAIKTNVAFHFY